MKKIEISSESWKRELTQEEYEEWVKYDDSHPWLANSLPMERILDMFLCNYRMKVKE
jgi:hypothetical protein